MISVCIATYNGEKYIREQLDSILPQLDISDEIILSDDGSQDETIAIIDSYLKKDSRIKFIKGPQQGPIANFEHALSISKGDIIFLADQDDVWLPNKVEVMTKYFAQHPDIELVISDLTVVDKSLIPIEFSYFEFRNVKTGFLHNIIKNKYIGAGMAFRSTLKKDALPFPKDLPMHDMWLGLLAAYNKRSTLINQSLTLYRRHDQNASEIKTKASLAQQFKWRYAIIKALIFKKVRRK